MKKLYYEFFYIPKYGKIREKVMLTRVAMTVAVLICCLAAMSMAAYAYFSYDVSSSANIIKASNFEAKVSIQITDERGATVDIIPITSNYKSFKTNELQPGKYYTVTITPTERSTAKTGFVVITATGCEETYHTQQLGVDENVSGGKTPQIIFKLMVTDQTDVVFLAHWGTSSYYDAYKNKGDSEELYITQEEEIKMTINGAVEPGTEETTAPSAETTSPEATQPGGE